MKNRVFFAAAFVAFGAVLGAMTSGTFSSAPPEPQNHQERPATAPQQDVEASATAIETVDDKKANKRDKKGEWYNAFLDHITDWLIAIFNGLLVYVTYRLVSTTGDLRDSTDKLWEAGERQIETAKIAADAAKSSADLAVIGQRPWVSITAEIDEPVFWNSTIIQIMLRITLENTGATPALGVWVETDLDYTGFHVPQAPHGRLREVAEKARLSSGEKLGASVLFPGDQRTHRRAVFIETSEIEAYAKITQTPFNFDDFLPPLMAMIFAVVTYRVSFNRQHHQTGAIYEFAVDKSPARAPHGSIPLEEAHLRQNWAGFAD